MQNTDSTKRFSNRVEDYIKYRPGYPKEIIDYLGQAYGVNPAMLVADIGAGTGISSSLFLNAGFTVLAVEPNAEMRSAAIEQLQNVKRFTAVDGTAENTTLAASSVDLIIAAQAFHWFNNPETKLEMRRILKPGGFVVFIWNERLTATDFEREYDAFIIQHAVDYVKVDHRNIDFASIRNFFAPNNCEEKIFPNHQEFDFTGLKGRLLSSSYMPTPVDAGYEAMITDLRALFNRHQQNALVRITYDTKLYISRLGE